MREKKEEAKFMMGLKRDPRNLVFAQELSSAYANQFKLLRGSGYKYRGSMILMKLLYITIDVILALLCGKSIKITDCFNKSTK